MTDKLFLHDYKSGTSYHYSLLQQDVNAGGFLNRYCLKQDLYKIFLTLVKAAVNETGVVLLDSGFSDAELQQLNIKQDDLSEQIQLNAPCITSTEELLHAVRTHADWELTLYTSGTTGVPKRVTHQLASLIRAVKTDNKHRDDVWGFAYNPTHMAGLQVFFQALLNGNSIINLFEADRETAISCIRDYGITHISATPTFYRMLLPLEDTFPTVKSLTSGGEKFDPGLFTLLGKSFPNARLRNIYASTEAGTILSAGDDTFSIRDDSMCRIQDGELLVNKALLGASKELPLDAGGWYATGDLVEVVSENPLRFRFLSRKNEMVNVGGYKVNPYETEQALQGHPAVKQAYVYGKASSVLGNILLADVIATQPLSEKDLRDFLAPLLQPYKIPRVINFVTSIELTRSGKLKRT
jgi:acyl-coenzyme A synthetase/AMP-(fatty) acid ligase